MQYRRDDRVRIVADGPGHGLTATVARTAINNYGEQQVYVHGAGVFTGPWYEDELELVFRLEAP